MASNIEKLRALYIKYDSLVASGNDVVADLCKEINNLELSILREVIIPKVAKLLCKETSELRCNIDCNLQSVDGKIEYSFCTENSPLVRASVSENDNMIPNSVFSTDNMNPEILNNLSSSISRISELSAEIELCKTNALKYISQLQEASSRTIMEASQNIDEAHSHQVSKDIILYCRSKACNAKGRLLQNRDIIILKGSVLRSDITPTYGPKKSRAEILARYCTLTKNGYMVLKDLPPMSVSGASGLCLGRSSNGNFDWKDENGTRLVDLT